MERGLKAKEKWDSFAHKVFYEICKEEVSAGNRPEEYLNATRYRNLQQKFLARTGRNYERKQFKKPMGLLEDRIWSLGDLYTGYNWAAMG